MEFLDTVVCLNKISWKMVNFEKNWSGGIKVVKEDNLMCLKVIAYI
jgi:hypothetical protein